MAATNKELEEHIVKRLELTQGGMDSAKNTILTAGLVVAVSISIPGLSDSTIFGFSGTKVVLALAISSAIFHILSFMFAERQVKRHDKMIGASVLVTRVENLLTLGNVDFQAKLLPWYYGKFLTALTTISNNVSTLLLITALSFYLYCLIIS